MPSDSDDDWPPASNHYNIPSDAYLSTFRRGQEPRDFPASFHPHGSFALDGIAIRSSGLGFVCSLALATAWSFRASYPQFPLFVAMLAFFHFMEFWVTARYNTRRAKVDAFILTSNGMAYNIAHTSAMAEALLEWWLIPGLKKNIGITAAGIVLVVVGQLARTLAMKHAGTNFSHYVALRRQEGHVLVKTGIYRYLRHPSYFGYYWWAIGTQLMLGNPICTIGFAIALWGFFDSRIKSEEAYLVGFFPGKYEQYRTQSWTGIPFIGRLNNKTNPT